jgi:hypothetical protein
VSFNLLLTTPGTFVYRHQSSLLHIELFFGHHFPFVKSASAQSLALVFLSGTGSFKGDNIIGHGNRPVSGLLQPLF